MIMLPKTFVSYSYVLFKPSFSFTYNGNHFESLMIFFMEVLYLTHFPYYGGFLRSIEKQIGLENVLNLPKFILRILEGIQFCSENYRFSWSRCEACFHVQGARLRVLCQNYCCIIEQEFQVFYVCRYCNF